MIVQSRDITHNTFLSQDIAEKVSFEVGVNRLKNLFEDVDRETV